MDHEPLTRDYRRLEQAAIKALEDPTSLPPTDVFPPRSSTLRLWHYPAFESSTSWLICHASPPASLTFVRQVTWNHVADAERFFERLQTRPERFIDRITRTKEGTFSRPTLLIHDFSLETPQYHPYLRELTHHHLSSLLPLHPPFGVDGETSGVEFALGETSLRLQWWGEGPQEWQALIATVQRLRQLLLQHAPG